MEESRGSERSPSGLDGRLRQALEPRPEVVERVVRGALSGRPRPARRLRLVPAVPVLAALVVAVLLAVRPDPKPAGRASISIENVGDMLIVRSREGGQWVVRSGETEGGSSPSGTLIMTYGGGR